MNITVLRDVQEKLATDADQVRSMLNHCGIRMINLMGGDGCGKTAFLERILPTMRINHRCAVLEGDITTTLDAQRIANVGTPVIQLQTEGSCHLAPSLVRDGLYELPLDDLDFVFVENVGNLVCPAEFDIGEHARMAMLSVTEGHDKPAKYPLLFSRADVIIISKCDLLAHTNFNIDECTRNIRIVNHHAPILRYSTHDALDASIMDWLRSA